MGIENDQAVQSHLAIMQSVIQRMASNSSSAKTACITLVSAILVIIADKNKTSYAFITLIPIILFCILDAYYLGLEKGFRISYNSFIKKLHTNTIDIDDLFIVYPSGNKIKLFFKSLISFSVWPFYFSLLALTYIAYKYII